MITLETCARCGKQGILNENKICYGCRERDYYSIIRENIQSGEETETYNENKIICPWCGELQEHDGDHDILYGDGDHPGEQCEMCGKFYTISTDVSYSYSTKREDNP